MTMPRPGETPPALPFRRMRLAILGAGWLGGSVGRNWVRAGHEVMFASRHPDGLAQMVARTGPGASAGSLLDAAAFCDAALLSVPYEPAPDIAALVGEALRGKVLINASNQPFDRGHDLARRADAIGLGPLTAELFPTAGVAIAFSAVDATDIAESFDRNPSDKLAVPVSADAEDAMTTAVQLIHDAGCVPLVIGGLDSSKSFMRHTRPFRANTTLDPLRRAFGLG